MASNVTETNGTTTKKETSKPAGTSRSSGPRHDPPTVRIRRFFQEVMVELRKTTWPSKPELFNSTKVVLGTVIVVGVYIWAVDGLLTLLTGALGFWK
jgi:preprotein translocase subunit SecE